MAQLAGYILTNTKKGFIENLRTVLMNCGIGGAHEYTSHRAILNTLSNNGTYFKITPIGDGHTDLQKQKLEVEQPLCRTRLIRTIDDLSLLQNGEYCKATTNSLPLIDGAIPPNNLLRMTISNRRDKVDQNEKFGKIKQALKVDSLRMIFVLDEENFETFTPLKNIPQYVKQFKMCTTTERSPRNIGNYYVHELRQIALKAGINSHGLKKADLWKRLKDGNHV